MFEQVVFAGGGHRCWWQAGFWDAVVEPLQLRPRCIAGVSAGAATACMLYASSARAGLDHYRDVLAGHPRNFYPGRLLRAGQSVFPHNQIYRRALHHLLGGENFVRLKRRAPEIRILFARPPRWLGPRSGVALGMLAYTLEKRIRRPLHPVYGRRLGFTEEIVRVSDCEHEQALVSLIIASSCTPPFTPIEYRDGRPTIDGGLIDNVPVAAVEPGRPTLVLTTRRYPQRASLFVEAQFTYVQPSRAIPVASWDYASPHAYEAAYRLGFGDGERMIDSFGRARLKSGAGEG